jgi:IS1 family transposase
MSEGEIKVPPDALAQSYLRQANKDGTGALVMYAYNNIEGKAVIHLASNRDDKTTQAFLGWVQKVDDRIVEVAARALASADNTTWDKLTGAEQHNYAQTARVALEAARVEQPKSLNIIRAS